MNSLDNYNQNRKNQALIRKNEYNQNPHKCILCSKPIYMKDTDKYSDIFRKKFCSTSCCSKYGHIVSPRNVPKHEAIINKLSDEKIINIFYSSNNLTDFAINLGYSEHISNRQTYVVSKLKELGLNLNDLKDKSTELDSITKKELFEKSSNWQSARSQIQRNARKRYESSNKQKQCVICGYDKHYEVAHIKAVSDFNDDTLISEINGIDNLIALCPNHHWEYDNTDFDIVPYLSKVN